MSNYEHVLWFIIVGLGGLTMGAYGMFFTIRHALRRDVASVTLTAKATARLVSGSPE